MASRRLPLVVLVVVGVVVLTGALLAARLLVGRASPAALLVAGDGRMRLVGEGGERALEGSIRTDAFDFPAVSPDGRTIAFVADEWGARVIYRLDLRTGERRELLRSSVEAPFNLAWSPDGRHINFLTAQQRGFIALVVPDDGSRPAETVAIGSSAFFTWSPDGSRLLFHINGHTAQGGRIELHTVGGDSASPILNDPGLFQAPAWAADGGQIFYVAQPPPEGGMSYEALESRIVRVGADGQAPTVLASEKRAGLRIVRAPDNDRIAYLVQEIARDGSFQWGALKLVDGTGGPVRTLSRPSERVTALFWSPDGRQIAYLAYSGAGYDPRGERAWRVVAVDSGAVRELGGSFAPSAEFINFLFYFDAYQHSFSPWSPDSQRLAYGASDGMYVLTVIDGTSTRIGEGAIGLWVRD